MKDYRLSSKALDDLDAIAAYIFEDNPERSVTFIDELTARFSIIAERPMSFPQSVDLPKGIRSSLHGRYRILFEVIEGIPHILRVVHGARDVASQLDQGQP